MPNLYCLKPIAVHTSAIPREVGKFLVAHGDGIIENSNVVDITEDVSSKIVETITDIKD